MQVRLPIMGTGVPDVFSGGAMKTVKVAGRLKAAGSNIRQTENAVKQTVQKANAKMEKAGQKNVSIKA